MKTLELRILTLAWVLSGVTPVGGQVRVENLVVTAGAAMEGYRGNLSSVTLPVVDPTDRASAAVGEFGARGSVFLVNNPMRGFRVDFDGGLRQFAASGFQLADYSPREIVGSVDGVYRQSLGSIGSLQAALGFKGHSVVDRPPMPLFLQPGYGATDAAVELRFVETGGIQVDAQLAAEWADYQSHSLFPQLDLLDNRSSRMEVGGTWGRDWKVRVYGAMRLAEFQRQSTNLPSDPVRRDKAIEVGGQWVYSGPLVAQLGASAIFNRSNSARPEYDAVRVRASLAAPLPYDFSATVYASLTGKAYKHDFEFARLVPGEEADNASVVYAALNRPIAPTLDAQVRFGWTRAETDLGGAFYQRYGVSFLINYRPLQ